MKVAFCILSLLSLTKTAHISSPPITDEYYWKEYAGVIPPDAVPGGMDLDGTKTFIGQAYIHKLGIFVVQIFPGRREVETAAYGIKKTNMNIKILCATNKNNFEWVSTNHTHFHVDMTDKLPVIGGYDMNGSKGMLHIGRLNFQGIRKIGLITSYKLEDARLYFPHNNAELNTRFYQVLVFRKQPGFSLGPIITARSLEE